MDLPKNMQVPYNLALGTATIVQKLLNGEQLEPFELEKLNEFAVYCGKKKDLVIRRMEYYGKRDRQ